MTCNDKGIAGQVVLYQELSDEERAHVESHITQCNDCAETFWTLDRSIQKLRKTGEKRRIALAHPAEEQIIRYAIDPKLVTADERARIQQHFEQEKCSECERIYWSIRESEKECARQPEEKSQRHFWQMISPAWRIAASAVVLVLAIVQAIEIREIVRMKQQIREQQTTAHDLVPLQTHIAANATAEPTSADQHATQISQPAGQSDETIAGLHRQLQPYLKPRADAAYVLLLSASRGDDAVPTASLDGSKLFVVLQANLSKEIGPYKTYKMLLQDSSGNTLKSDSIAQQDGTLNYFVRSELLPAGSYTLLIYGMDHGQQHYLLQFPFRIAPAP